MNTTEAKHIVACDECGASIGELYPNNKNNISVHLQDMSKHNKGDSETQLNSKADILDFASKQHHFCDEACMMAHLNKRAKAKAKLLKRAKANQIDAFGNIEIDITSEAAYISTKERDKLGTEHYLDPKRRSFPIRPGHECTDLNAALHRIGTYGGSMSHEELHSKIISKMKSHGCPLPKSDK
jgi:hypothetical protein